MNPTNKTPRSLVSLKLPKSVGQLIPYATGIVTGMTNNPAFPNPVVPLGTVTGAIAALHSAETAALTRVKGAVASRNEKRAALVSLLEQLRAYVQARADASPENGASIIESAGMAGGEPGAGFFVPWLSAGSCRPRREPPCRCTGSTAPGPRTSCRSSRRCTCTLHPDRCT